MMPYLYSKAVEAHKEGTPMMRPMVFEYPSDPVAAYLETQYMLGDALLVAPVLREDKKAAVIIFRKEDDRFLHRRNKGRRPLLRGRV